MVRRVCGYLWSAPATQPCTFRRAHYREGGTLEDGLEAGERGRARDCGTTEPAGTGRPGRLAVCGAPSVHQDGSVPSSGMFAR